MRALLGWMRRLAGSVRPARTDADLQAELRAHLEMAADEEARRQTGPVNPRRRARLRLGSVDQAMESVRDQRGFPWIASMRADVVFAWRQIARHRTASVAVVLSLGLAMGATLAAFRLVDAVLLRPLPVANPSQLYVVTTTFENAQGAPDLREAFDYPTYRSYADLVAGQAELMLLGMASRRSIVIDGGEPETILQQFVSGNTFAPLGLRPAAGRLLGEQDDTKPGGHPVVVLSYDYWQRRYAGDRSVIGRTFRMGAQVHEIVGVAEEGFTGTEPGTVTDLFVPSMMNPDALQQKGWSWFRIWLRPRPGVGHEQIQARLDSHFRAANAEQARQFPSDTSPASIQAFLDERLLLQPASAGASQIQRTFSKPLWILASLAALLLDVRTAAMGMGLVAVVTMLFGLMHALRASATTPFGPLKEIRGPRSHRRLTGAIVGVQVALCVFLLMAASLFAGTFDRLQQRPLGFSPEQLLHVIVETARDRPAADWIRLADSLETVPGIESATVAGWAPLTGNVWRSTVLVPGATPPADAPNWVSVGPGYFADMRLPLIDGREFQPDDHGPRRDGSGKPVAGVGIVNETFARVYFGGENPVGRT